MLDHQKLFWRAAGNLVSVVALGTAVFHYHNPFQKHYQKHRCDVEKDRKYIKKTTNEYFKSVSWENYLV